ncbi:unnamed protein product [Cuscuta campestris]|uniref:Uncharacterized protein n=1 Tax=Cuscuta campestris TaxID=132261 RepID=A0A484MNW7_9ASTE|nr:unnamed protein product [Cuscuta campestris]
MWISPQIRRKEERKDQRNTRQVSASAAAELASQTTSWSGPPGVDIGPGAADPFISGLKRPSSEGLPLCLHTPLHSIALFNSV